jgi:hypothetical protein
MTRYATTPLPTADEAEYTLPGATNRQLDYIASLLQQREVKPETAAALGPKIAVQFVANEERGDSAPAVDGISKKRASESISKLLALPKRRNELPARPAKTRDIVAETRSQTVADRITPEKVPAGHYAVDNEAGELRFYAVWWAPITPGRDPFFKVYVEHGPDDSEVPFKSALTILRKIAEDPRAAALRYGREIKSCSSCGKRLTNRISRLLDIGPVCGGRFYSEDDWKARKATARDALRAAGLDPKADAEEGDDLDAIREQAGL